MLRWRPAESQALPAAVRDRLLASVGGRLSNDGDLVIACDRHREQGRNVAECLSRLRETVQAALRPPKRRVATKPTRASRERRIDSKRQRSAKKQLRKPPKTDD